MGKNTLSFWLPFPPLSSLYSISFANEAVNKILIIWLKTTC